MVTPTIIPTRPTIDPASGSVGDAYEPNDICREASPIETDGIHQLHSFEPVTAGNGIARQGIDADWITFRAHETGIYRVVVGIPSRSQADVDILYGVGCGNSLIGGEVTQMNMATRGQHQQGEWDEPFAPGARVDIRASAGEQFYLRLANTVDANPLGATSYHISVRRLPDEQPTGAVIILAGRLRLDDPLQVNINQTAQKVYRLFHNKGVSEDDILFLSTNSELPGHDREATIANLRYGITTWAKDRVSATQALTLYLIDHGGQDRLYVDELNGETLHSNYLNQWLGQLEAEVPELVVNVVVEACAAGSFIDPQGGSIGKENRLIITSSDIDADAYASDTGIQFTDAFVTRLYMGDHLASAFYHTRAYLEHINPNQLPWLDGDGNGMPTEPNDVFAAAERGFEYQGSFRAAHVTPNHHGVIKWPPYIINRELTTEAELVTGQSIPAQNPEGLFRVEVRDDEAVADVWAVVYPPDYIPPTGDGEFNTQQDLTRVTLTHRPELGTHIYEGHYTNFTQGGLYQIVVYAKDWDDLYAQPVTFTLERSSPWQVYLPVVSR